jgi:hypothetical protein
MDNNTTPPTAPTIITVAWTRYAQFDAVSLKRSRAFRRMRWWITFMGILATLFAILVETYPAEFPALGALVLKILLIATPIIASIFAAFIGKKYASGDWLVTRAGAEEIQKEIYFFRTILQKDPTRRIYLEKRLADIQRQVFRNTGGDLAIEPYAGQLPPYYYPDDPYSDPGFHNLTGDEYFQYRLSNQLAWHTNEINELEVERTRLFWLILLAGGIGAFLAALGGDFSLWVAFTASITAALIGWQELRNLDETMRNYSKLIRELVILHDHWLNLEPEERTEAEFYKMVKSTEELLWTQNMEYVKSMQNALAEASLEKEANLINRVLRESVEADERFKKSIEDSVVKATTEAATDAQKTLTERYQKTFGSLAEDASSETVQAELAAMEKAAAETAQAVIVRFTGIADKLKEIADEFAGVEVGRDTPPSILNDLLSRYPKSTEVKG